MSRVALQLAYDGSAYAGFQIQRNAVTVASKLHDALHAVYHSDISFQAAGRTDTGVHASAQHIHFDPPHTAIPTKKIPYALNTRLPEDIRIVASYDVSKSFHARFDAVRRSYVYTLYREGFVPPYFRCFSVPWVHVYDIDRMQRDASQCVGSHDFRAFAQCGENEHTVRTVSEAYFVEDGAFLKFVISANGFLRKMVRSIVGTICEWEKKRLRGLSMIPIDVLIARRDRSLVGKTAAAHGLCLDAVDYEEINTRVSN